MIDVAGTSLLFFLLFSSVNYPLNEKLKYICDDLIWRKKQKTEEQYSTDDRKIWSLKQQLGQTGYRHV